MKNKGEGFRGRCGVKARGSTQEESGQIKNVFVGTLKMRFLIVNKGWRERERVGEKHSLYSAAIE